MGGGYDVRREGRGRGRDGGEGGKGEREGRGEGGKGEREGRGRGRERGEGGMGRGREGGEGGKGEREGRGRQRYTNHTQLCPELSVEGVALLRLINDHWPTYWIGRWQVLITEPHKHSCLM